MAPSSLRFGDFELALLAGGGGELRRDGRHVRLQPLASRVLVTLASRPGELVTRAELREAVWGSDTFIEIDAAINTAIRQVRRGLGDDARGSRFVETVPRVGYRFVAAVEKGESIESMAPRTVAREREHRPRSDGELRPYARIGAVALLALLVAAPAVRPNSPARPRLAVLPVMVDERHPEWRAPGERLLEQSLLALVQQADGRARVLGRAATQGLYEGRYRVDLVALTGADFLLDTSLRELPEQRVRVHVKVVQGRGSEILWGNDYEMPAAALEVMLPDLASSFGRRLLAVASGRVPPRQQVPPAVVAEALTAGWQAFAQGHYLDAVAAFDEARRLDPRSGTVRAALAEAHLFSGFYGEVRPWTDAYALGLAHAQEAVRLAPADARAHAMLGGAHLWLHRDFTAAERELHRAIELDPDSGEAHVWLGTVHTARGRAAAAIAEQRIAIAIDPCNTFVHAQLAHLLLFAGDPRGAERAARLTLTLDPSSVFARRVLILALLQQDREAEAADVAGLRAGASAGERWQTYLSTVEPSRTSSPLWLARVAAAVGERERALRWLRAAEADHADGLVYLRADPAFGSLRDSREWQAIADRVLPPARLTAAARPS